MVAAGRRLALTLAQLAFAALVPGIERFADKAFGARLLAYAVLMAVVPVAWFLLERRRESRRPPPYGAFTLVMLPFLVDVTGNSLDLYDSVVFWDDLNHFVTGRSSAPAWAPSGWSASARRGPSCSPSPGSAPCWRSAGSSASGGPSSGTGPSSTRRTRTPSGT